MVETPNAITWEEVIKGTQNLQASQLESMWSNWSQGDGFQISCSLGDWGSPETYCGLLTVEFERDHAICNVDNEVMEKTIEELATKKQSSKTPVQSYLLNNYVLRSFLRSGWLVHSNMTYILDRITQVDDVIIGADTNVLLECFFSAVLLPMLERYENPNWILIIVPKVVTAEIERKADNKYGSGHPWEGYPSLQGRMAQRALQEIMALDTSHEHKYKGMSVMTVGELPLNYVAISGDSVLKDSTIRDQFRGFLREITFHKSAFLLSEDRVNVMMARAEGIEALYLQKPAWQELLKGPIQQDSRSGMPLWAMIYELCVSFGAIKIAHGSQVLILKIFWPEKHVKDWEQAELQVSAV